MATTVNPTCIANYKKISQLWWSNKGVMKALLNFNLVRIPMIRSELLTAGAIQKENVGTSAPFKGLKILDAGCGGGFLSESLAKLGANVTGIDPCSDLIEVAKSHAALHSSSAYLKYECTTVEEYTTKNIETYDIVITTEVLDYTDNKDLFIESCVKFLKPGGSIFVETKNRSTLMWLTMIVFNEYILRQLPRGTSKYEKFVTPEETKQLLKKYNCHTISTSGIFSNIFTKQSRKVSSMNGFYMVHAVKGSTNK